MRAHGRVCLVTAVLLDAVAGLAIHSTPDRYAATTILVADDDTSSAAPSMPTQTGLPTSAAVLLPVIDRLHLTCDPVLAPPSRSPLQPLRDTVLQNLARSLTLQRRRNGHLLYVTVTHESPTRVVQIADAITGEYLSQRGRHDRHRMFRAVKVEPTRAELHLAASLASLALGVGGPFAWQRLRRRPAAA